MTSFTALFHFLFVLLSCATPAIRGQCTRENLVTNLGPSEAPAAAGGLVSQALVANDQSQPPAVLIVDQNVVCLAAAEMRGEYRLASVIVNFTCGEVGGLCVNSNTNLVRQFRFGCAVDGSAWEVRTNLGTDHIVTEPTGNFNMPLRTDCGVCLSPMNPLGVGADPNTHCISCDSSCSGLNLCTSSGAEDCCNYYDQNMCVRACPSGESPNQEFICVGPCSELDSPMSGTVAYSDMSRAVNTVATYSCNDGYTLVGASSRTCTAQGSNTAWSGSAATCEVGVCSELDSPMNGNVAYSNISRVVDTVATYSCNDGYTLAGGSSSRTCTAQGSTTSWSGSAATCEGKRRKLSVGAIVGIVIACVVVLLAVVVVTVIVIVIVIKKKQ